MRKFLLLLLFFFCVSITAQYATKHYIAPSPWQYWSNANEIVIATTDTGSVTVTLKRSNGTLITTLTVTASNPVSYRFVGNPTSVFRNAINTTTSDRGLFVEATAPVSINLRNIASDTAGTSNATIKGNASLVSFGNEGIGLAFRLGYYRSSYIGIENNAPLYSVMALEDGTTISLNGTTLTTLNTGQSRLFTATMGSLLTANKPIVANVGTYGDMPQSCNGNGEDGTVDQIAPINKLGKQYILVRGNGTPGTGLNYPEQSTIIASEPNTSLNIVNFDATGNQISSTTQVLANAGDYISIFHGNAQNIYSSTFVNATKPIVIYSATAVDCETDISTVFPIGGCAGSTHIITTKFISYDNTNLPYFGYTILESATEPVLINGTNMETLTGNVRIPIGNTGFYMLRFTNITIGNPQSITITSNARLTTSIIQQGSGFSMSGFFSAFSDSPEPPAEITSNSCSTTLETTPGLAPYQWYLDGVLIPNATTNTYVALETGNYSVIGTRSCGLTAPSSPIFISITPCGDLEVEKEVVSMIGDEAIFQITASNIGNTDDTAVEVSDLLPNGYQFVSATSSTGTYNTVTGIWIIGNLNSGQSETLTIVATINDSGNTVNTATITGSNTDIDTSNNTAQATAESSILSLTKSSQEATYYNVGDVIVYDLVLTNTGQATISNILISDANADIGSITPATILSLATGESITISASHTVTSSDALTGNVINQALASGFNSLGETISTLSDDPETTTLDDATVTPIVLNSDLEVVKTNNQSVYAPGTTTQYEITITNNGPSDALNVMVNDPIPLGITQITWSGNSTSGTGSLTDIIPLLLNGETVTYLVTMDIPNNYTVNLTNIVFVSSSIPDPNPDCPQCTDTDTECVPPAVQTPTPIMECDTNGNGLKRINLTTKNDEIISPNAGLLFTYYLNTNDLNNGTAIPDPENFQMTTPYTQSLLVQITDTIGCKTVVDLTIQISAIPSPVLLLEDVLCQNNLNSYNVTIYENEILNGEVGTFIAGYFTNLSNAENDTNPIPNPNNTSITSNEETIYIRVENALGCFTISTVQLTVIPLTVVDLADMFSICNNANGTLISPAFITTGLSTTDYTFLWYKDGQLLSTTDSSLIATLPGSYTVEVSNNYGCPSGSDTTTVILSNGPETFTASLVTSYFAENAVVFAQATGTGNFLYSLDNGSEQEENYFSNVSSGMHHVSVRDSNGCGGILTVEIMVIDYPKFFTPNADGYNDSWNIWDLKSQPNSIIYIFDRYGKLLTSIKPSGEGWNGNYIGHALPSTDYWFKVIYLENHEQKVFRSHFSMKR
ncbi:T9SS type B sorting domain-containing protein [Flavobacterium jejuense]|uniref:T9SS type B sorting domain-containing protein n=1 Tax=Flavobacterium jejuense TaxID=1544455 RepID=A0ABX0J0C3_9FLAO|nr:T9SS type B sorting domain-containing protein [Flavobacterium jejuense]NHN27405.1 T9SS type B sorting domain-containing protein [Flavobacterium jejuense]